MTRQECKEGEEASRANPVETGGLDTLHLSIYGGWDEAAFDDLTKRLDSKQRKAREGEDADAIIVSRAGEELLVTPDVAKLGIAYYSWIVEWNGCRVYLRNCSTADDEKAAVFVQLGSLILMTLGEAEVYRRLQAMLADFGFQHSRESVSRVDLCVDIPGRDVKQYTKLAFGGCEITKAKSGRLFFGATIEDHETFYRGGDRVLMRIYDKLNQVANDPAKENVLIAKRWGGVRPESATRIEFQVSREVLRKRFGVRSLEDLRQALPKIAEWLTEDWYRLAESAVDRENRNHARAVTSELWRNVQAAFAAWVAIPAKPWTVPAEVFKAKADRLDRQSNGCIAKRIAIFNPSIVTVKQVAAFLARRGEDVALDMLDKIEKIRDVLQTRAGDAINWQQTIHAAAG